MPLFGTWAGISFFRPNARPIVFGGVLSEDSTYWYRTFFGNGTLTVSNGALAADVLIVAGGGGGGADGNGAGGGGGAGGLVGYTSTAFAPTSFTVTIGAGGAGGATAGPTYGTQGVSSSVTGLTTAVGGGYGSARSNAGSGGSGGGTGDGTNGTAWTPGSATSGQGYSGSNSALTNQGAGAGGGAGGAATASSGTTGGTGGVGSSTYSSWGLATKTGQNVSGTVYFAGGGGGAAYNTSTNGAGGNGGGGRGGYSGTAPVAGTVNTGGGGGGAGNVSSTISGGAGGSGIVIVRYPKAAVDNTTDATSYELIGTILLTSAQSSVTFAGIPASLYKHLQLRASYRGAANLSGDNPQIQFNSDSTYTNYYTHWLYGNGSSVASSTNQSTNYHGVAIAQNMPDAGSTANIYGSIVVDVLDAFNTSKNKTTRSLFGGTGYNMVGLGSGAWFSTAAVSSITVVAYPGTLANSIASGSRFSLYGVR